MSNNDFDDKATARDLAAQGYAAPVLANFKMVEGDKGKDVAVPLSMNEVLAIARKVLDEWPRSCGGRLFVDTESDDDIFIFERQTSAAVIAWMSQQCEVRWFGKGGPGFVTKDEFVEALSQTARRYKGTEAYPHEPPVNDVYYRRYACPKGDGKTLEAFVDLFSVETDFDRDLLKAAVLTTFWGGSPGARPLFVFDGVRGSGKSKSVEAIAYIKNTSPLTFSTNVNTEQITKRLFSKDGRRKGIVLFDNVKTRNWSWADIESLITIHEISGHQMFIGEGSRLNLITYFATFNAAALGKDLAQRSVIVKFSRPDYSDAWEARVRDFIDAKRPELIGDILIALRAKQAPLKKLPRWTEWAPAVLCRLPNPELLMAVIRDRQGAADSDTETGSLLQSHIERQLSRYETDSGEPYDLLRDRVHIPSKLLADWFRDALGVSMAVTQVSGTVKQLIDENELPRICENKNHDNGRGFLWVGKDADHNSPVKYDIGERAVKYIAGDFP